MTSVYENLKTVFESASTADLQYGMPWYTEARMIVRQIARTYSVTTSLVAAVMAVASQNTTWEKNVEYTWAFVDQLAENGRVRGGHFGQVIDKINRLWQERRAYAKIIKGKSGLKLEAFYRNLSGDRRAVTVDRHMYRAAGYNGASFTSKRNAEIQAAVKRLAKENGIMPEQMQAVIWSVVRPK